jgi:hypothetical protein
VALATLAILGALAWSTEVVLIALLTQPQPIGTLATADGYSEWIVVALGLLVGILGAVRAARSGASRWLVLFITLTALIFTLLGLGFLVLIAVVFLTIDSPNQTLNAVVGSAFDVVLLFPIVVFVSALIYVVRGGTPSGKTAGQS